MPIQTSCPSCSRALRVPDNLLGKNVRCPSCETTFIASTGEEFRPEAAASASQSDGKAFRAVSARPPRNDDDEEIRLRSRLQFNDEDDEYDDQPRRRRRYLTPHRGASILTTGILSIVLSIVICPLVGLIGISAVVMGKNDLREMREGRMDDSGHGQTMAGFVMGIIGTVLGGLSVLGGLAMIAIMAAK
ncbi:MAG: DUF4190 domain-containing protein [Gemmataceae bacterium]